MIIAVANQKGGIGKTTTCLNLAACASQEGKRTLMIDLDPQGNLTKTFAQLQEDDLSMYHVFCREIRLGTILRETPIENLYLAPADVSLAGLEREENTDFKSPYRLHTVLLPYMHDFDLMIIDTPPTLGILTVGAMTTVNRLLIPIQPSFYPLQGTNDLLATYQHVKTKLNPTLELMGVLITMHDPRTTIAKEAITEIQNAFGDKVLATMIHRSVKIEESPAAGQSVITYAPKSKAAQEYRVAYRELMARA
jgi:chromosome partitioning protein